VPHLRELALEDSPEAGWDVCRTGQGKGIRTLTAEALEVDELSARAEAVVDGVVRLEEPIARAEHALMLRTTHCVRPSPR